MSRGALQARLVSAALLAALVALLVRGLTIVRPVEAEGLAPTVPRGPASRQAIARRTVELFGRMCPEAMPVTVEPVLWDYPRDGARRADWYVSCIDPSGVIRALVRWEGDTGRLERVSCCGSPARGCSPQMSVGALRQVSRRWLRALGPEIGAGSWRLEGLARRSPSDVTAAWRGPGGRLDLRIDPRTGDLWAARVIPPGS